jgi:acetyl-CoA carboxylase biotin carboxyl carrier protein
MTIDEIKELLDIFTASGIAEMELQRGEDRLRLRRAPNSQEITVPAAMPILPAAAAAAAPAPAPVSVSPPPASAHSAPAAPKPAEPDSGNVLVKSPIVGTYYECPAPGAAPFVKVGDSVEPGQVLCIIESMKLMNEIESEVAGTIVAKLVENGRPVEYGEALFAIRPR